jgi:hypothetical protein
MYQYEGRLVKHFPGQRSGYFLDGNLRLISSEKFILSALRVGGQALTLLFMAAFTISIPRLNFLAN